MGTFDGPGLRLVVFLQGCNFRCLYCANPDTIAIGKGGQLIPDEEVVRRAVSEKPFFGKRGGITFSGGEPTVQAKELIPICHRLHEEGIHICLDSNGSIRNDYVTELLGLVDMVLLDCKHICVHQHRVITQQSNENTLATARYLAEIGKPVRLRHVLLPGYSNQPEALREMGAYFGQFDNIERLEILPYHTYGIHKYETLGWKYPLEGVTEPTPEQVDVARQILEPYFQQIWTQ